MNFYCFFLFSVLALMFCSSQARLSDEHAIQMSRPKFRRTISNVFFGERRYVGFGKFVGSGDALSSVIGKKPAILRQIIFAKIIQLSQTNSNFLRSWKQIVGPLIKIPKRPTDKAIFSPSGPTSGWYYGSQAWNIRVSSALTDLLISKKNSVHLSFYF